MSNHELSNDVLCKRIQYLEAQCRSLRLNMKYQRYHFMEKQKTTISEETASLLLQLVPSKYRSMEKLQILTNSENSWKRLLRRYPFKIGLWMTARRLQQGRKNKLC